MRKEPASHGSFRRPHCWLAGLAVFLALTAGCDVFVSQEARIARARDAMAIGDYRAASIELKHVLDSAPGNAEARLAMAEASLALGDAATAEKEVRRALAAGIPPQRVALVQGRAMLALGESAELLRQLNDRALPVPEPEWSVLKADALVTLGDLPAAEALYRSALKLSPAHGRATIGLALVSAAQGRESEALASLAGFLHAHPDSADAWLASGEIYARASRYSEARAAFEQASSPKMRGVGMPQQLSALAGLADTQLALGDFDSARGTLERMRQLAGGSTQARLIAARLFLVDQDYANAIAELQPLVTAMPTFATARFLMGAALLAQGSVEQAESHLSNVVQSNPGNVEARKLLAKARLELQLYDAAMQVLTPAMQDATADAEVTSLLSEAKFQAGAKGEAVAILERAALREPDNVGLRLDLAAALIATGDGARALDLLQSLPHIAGDHRREILLVSALSAAKGPAEARSEVERLVEQYPRDPDILALGAEYAASQGEYSIARQYLQRALALEPANPAILAELARTEARAGNLESAEATLRRLHELPGSRTEASLGLVEIARLKGNVAEMRARLEQIRAEDTGAVEPRLMLARLMLGAKEAAPAAAVLAEAVAIAPRDTGLRLRVAVLLSEFSRYDEALRQAQEAVQLSPASSKAWVEVARLQLALNQSRLARASAEKAEAIDRDSIEAVGLLAWLDLQGRNREAALERVLALVNRKPEDARAAVLEGDVRMALGQPREAARAFERAMTLSPDLQIAAKQSAAMREAGMANAEAPLARWVARTPEDPKARALLAEAYQLAGRRDKAIEQYERLAAHRSAGFAVLNNLAWLYYEGGDDRAEAMARRAYDLASSNAAVIDTYGWILVEKGKVPEGLEALAVAIKQAPDNPDIRFHYAVALERSGEIRRAMDALDTALGAGTDFASRAQAEKMRRDLVAHLPAGNDWQ